MKTQKFKYYIGGTADYMKIIMNTTKQLGKLSSNDAIFYDIWFIRVKTAGEANPQVVYYCGPLKTSHKVLCLDNLEKLTKECPGGSQMCMRISPRVPGYIPLMDILYKYIYQKFLGFIAAEGGVSTVPGVPYLSCCFYNYLNVSICPVFCPCVIGRYFSACNEI